MGGVRAADKKRRCRTEPDTSGLDPSIHSSACAKPMDGSSGRASYEACPRMTVEVMRQFLVGRLTALHCSVPLPLPTTHGMVSYWVVGRGSGMEQHGAPLPGDDKASRCRRAN